MEKIKNNVKKTRSANLILATLLELMKEKPYDSITVTDINKRSYVARTTFYSLFNNMDDVLYYAVDQAFDSLMDDLVTVDLNNLLNFFVEKTFNNYQLFKSIMDANRYYVINRSFEKHNKILIGLRKFENPQEKRQAEYTLSIFGAILLEGLHTWYRFEDSPDINKLSKIIASSIKNLNELLDSKQAI